MVAMNSATGEITVTNYGLVRADNVVFTPPTSDAYYRIELMASVPSSISTARPTDQIVSSCGK